LIAAIDVARSKGISCASDAPVQRGQQRLDNSGRAPPAAFLLVDDLLAYGPAGWSLK